MSTTRYLCSVLKQPIYNAVPERGQSIQYGEAKNILGIRHETLKEALDITKKYGKRLEDFKKVVATIRHPYDLEISMYYFFKKKVELGFKIHPLRKEVVTKGFEAFVASGQYHRMRHSLKDFVTLDGEIPENMELIRFENLVPSYRQLAAEFGNGKEVEFSHENKSPRDMKVSDLSQEIKDVIYLKYQWVFDQGFYER